VNASSSNDPHGIEIDEQRARAELAMTAEWSLAGRASMALAQVLSSLPRATYEGPVEEAGPFLQLSAQRIVGFRLFRAVRAAMAVLAVGYEPEARALDRVIFELTSHRNLIEADDSGETAQQWLEGKAGRGIGAKVKANAPDDLYGNLSQDAHGDPRPVWRLYGEATETYILGPQRKPLASRLSLLIYASAACDQAVILCRRSSTRLSGLLDLHGEVKSAWRQAHEEDDAGKWTPPRH
jgi:hypothetical protein